MPTTYYNLVQEDNFALLQEDGYFLLLEQEIASGTTAPLPLFY
jgi:hypothetical protein